MFLKSYLEVSVIEMTLFKGYFMTGVRQLCECGHQRRLSRSDTVKIDTYHDFYCILRVQGTSCQEARIISEWVEKGP